jgi:hypothetical protein
MSNGWKTFQMRSYGREQKHLLNDKLRKENGVGLAIHYGNHKAHQIDTHWTGTLRVQGRGVDREQPGKSTIEWEKQRAGKS